MKQSPITFDSGSLTLEGILQLSDEENPSPAMVVCHPHPLYGGDMSNNVVLALCKAAASAGMASLRFNFRGVGLSEGTYNGGQGESEDIRAAIHYLQNHPNINWNNIAVDGYSFGANASLEAVNNNASVSCLILVGCSWSVLAKYKKLNSTIHTLIINGERDNLVHGEDIEDIAQSVGSLTEIRPVAGANHFFQGHEDIVFSHATAFLHRWIK
jgi:alpha/beta superfamily hydrolase